VAPGLGPPRPAQHEWPLSKTPIQTVLSASRADARPTGRLGGSPTGRPWVFALSTILSISAASLRPFPQPIPRIRESFAGHYCRLVSAGPRASTQGGLSPRMAESTIGGDLNPTCLELLGSLVSGGLIAGRRPRRTRNSLLRTVTLIGPDSVVRSLFLFRRPISRPTTRGNISSAKRNSHKRRDSQQQ
jgi:hypothetical protein